MVNINREKYPYPGTSKIYQMTNGVNNTETTPSSHKSYYTATEVDSMIKNVMSKIVDSKGIIAENSTFENLPNPDASNVSTIYNVQNAFITDNRFVEDVDKVYPAGTNVIVVKTEDNTYKFDVLMGEIKPVDESEIEDIIDSL